MATVQMKLLSTLYFQQNLSIMSAHEHVWHKRSIHEYSMGMVTEKLKVEHVYPQITSLFSQILLKPKDWPFCLNVFNHLWQLFVLPNRNVMLCWWGAWPFFLDSKFLCTVLRSPSILLNNKIVKTPGCCSTSHCQFSGWQTKIAKMNAVVIRAGFIPSPTV